jgi:DNA polymerase-3 subunit delta
VLIWGEDEFAVQQRARQIFKEWCPPGGGADPELLDARAGNSGEALRSLARLREALQTLPFFGSEKVIWFQDCSFLGDDRTSGAAAVTEALAALAQELKSFRWTGVRLLISAAKVDKRRAFFKTVEAVGQTEEHAGLSLEDRDWADRAEAYARQQVEARQKRIHSEALGRLVAAVGPNLRQLNAEAEKLSLYVGDRPEIVVDDVAAVVSRSKHARAFALGEALGDRDLPRALRALDEELWEIRLKVDKSKSAIGLLYGLISKVRTLLLLKELVRQGHLKADLEGPRVKAALDRVPAGLLPADKRYNPGAMHPFVVAKALHQTQNYAVDELVQAMDALLTCNQRLVSSGLEDDVVLQQTLVQIIGQPRSRKPAGR